MDQESLFYESLSDALADVVKACGGAKVIGARLWPEKSVQAAHSQLLDCLNDARPAKLSPEQVLFLMREGRKINCHAAMNYLARETGYADPQPIEPEDERARLQREYIDAVKDLQALTGRMERVGLIRSVA